MNTKDRPIPVLYILSQNIHLTLDQDELDQWEAIHWGEGCLVQARTGLKWMSRDQPKPFLLIGL